MVFAKTIYDNRKKIPLIYNCEGLLEKDLAKHNRDKLNRINFL